MVPRIVWATRMRAGFESLAATADSPLDGEVVVVTEAVVWLVVWFILAGTGTWLAVALMSLIGVGIATASDKVWPAAVCAFLGWVLGVAWLIFAAVHVVLQVIDVVHLATA